MNKYYNIQSFLFFFFDLVISGDPGRFLNKGSISIVSRRWPVKVLPPIKIDPAWGVSSPGFCSLEATFNLGFLIYFWSAASLSFLRIFFNSLTLGLSTGSVGKLVGLGVFKVAA